MITVLEQNRVVSHTTFIGHSERLSVVYRWASHC